MIFTSIPDNYAPIASPLLYRFSFDEQQPMVTVKIVDVAHGKTLVTRQLYDVQSGEIDVAPYLKRSLALRPADGGTAIVDADGLYAVIAVEIDGERSVERYFSSYPITPGESALFRSTAKQCSISGDESDYIVIYAPNGGSAVCEFYAEGQICGSINIVMKAQEGLQILKIQPEASAADADYLILEIDIDGITDYLTYNIVPKPEGATRLMWSGADGQVQFYTFPTLRSCRKSIEKRRIEANEGRVVVSCCSETTYLLQSDFETAAEIERLGEILESEFVYLDCGVESTRVDVVSTESEVRYGGALNTLQVEIRSYYPKEARL